jgi:alpha-1,3-mannosyltransferase
MGKVANETLLAAAAPYVNSVMSSTDTTFKRLECPKPEGDRYAYLQRSMTETKELQPRFFFALDLYEAANIIPRLLGSVVETIRYLGPKNCVLSVVEGGSDDGTFEILQLLSGELETLGAQYHLTSSSIDTHTPGADRIGALAALRNLALKPLIDDHAHSSQDTTIIFLNDVALCMEDILELIHQRHYQGADMTCGMDWTYVGDYPSFYDVWIARSMTGETFFRIPPDGSWDNHWDLFWDDAMAKDKYGRREPFQVFSCWNGAAVFTAKPFMDKVIKFRNVYKEECHQGEPKLLAKDFWWHGYGKIAVVPSVNVEYSDDAAGRVKNDKGTVRGSLSLERGDEKIEWRPDPPVTVKCMKGFEHQFFVAWNESLAENDPIKI